VPVHAFIASIGTSPEPTVLLVLDGLDEVLADLLGSCLQVPMLAKDDVAQLLLVPAVHGILLLILLLGFLGIAGVGVEILLGGLALETHVMAELALPALLAVALLVVDTDDGLGIHAKGDLLHLHGLEQLGRLLGGILCRLLFCGATGLLGLLPFGFCGLAGRRLGLKLGDLFLCLSAFFL
jgi:hypothetical protein